MFCRGSSAFLTRTQILSGNWRKLQCSQMCAQYSIQKPEQKHEKSKVESIKQAVDGKFRIYTVPNVICAGRILATPVIGYLVVQHQYTPAFCLFIGAGLSDLLDGYIARNFRGQQSLLGSVLDPVADKLLISVMFVSMSYAGLIPITLTSIVLLRDICLIVGGFYKRYQTMEPPYSLNRFFNPEVSSMQVVPTFISKLNTVLQLSVVASALASPVFDFSISAQHAISGLELITAATTIWSGLQYANGKAFKKV